MTMSFLRQEKCVNQFVTPSLAGSRRKRPRGCYTPSCTSRLPKHLRPRRRAERAASHVHEQPGSCSLPRPLSQGALSPACMLSVPFTPTLNSARASEAHSCQRPDGMLSVCALCLCSLSVLSVCALCLCPRHSLSLSLCYKSAGLANRAALATATPEPTATRAPWRLANLATPEAIAAASVAGGTPRPPRIGVP